jgi:hypothetical protein
MFRLETASYKENTSMVSFLFSFYLQKTFHFCVGLQGTVVAQGEQPQQCKQQQGEGKGGGSLPPQSSHNSKETAQRKVGVRHHFV